MALEIEPSGASCGATIRGVDLRGPLSTETIAEIRHAWLDHQVIGLPGQTLSLDELERLAPAFGEYGEDPFIAPLPGHPHVIEVKREADETTPLFAEGIDRIVRRHE